VYAIVLDHLVAAVRAEGDVMITAIVAPLRRNGFAPDSLDANIGVASPEIAHRRRDTLAARRLPEAATLGWGGCPGFLSLSRDVSRCPAADSVIVAIGQPEPRAGPPGPEAVVSDSASAEAWVTVATATTFLDAGGGYTRLMTVYLGYRDGGWRVCARRHDLTVE
jgi:hypothetical protein